MPVPPTALSGVGGWVPSHSAVFGALYLVPWTLVIRCCLVRRLAKPPKSLLKPPWTQLVVISHNFVLLLLLNPPNVLTVPCPPSGPPLGFVGQLPLSFPFGLPADAVAGSFRAFKSRQRQVQAASNA